MHVYRHLHTTIVVWKSEDSFQVLSFCNLGPGYQAQVIRHCSQGLYPLHVWPGSSYFSFLLQPCKQKHGAMQYSPQCIPDPEFEPFYELPVKNICFCMSYLVLQPCFKPHTE